MLFSTLKKIETPSLSVRPSVRPSRLVYWLNGRWFLQIPVVDRDSWNLYPLYPLFPCSDFVSQMWGPRGGNVFLTFYAISNISRKKKLGIQNNYFSFNVFFVVFLYAGNIEKCPVTYILQLLVKWEVVSPNSRYREFYHEIGNIEKCLFTYWLNGGDGFSKS